MKVRTPACRRRLSGGVLVIALVISAAATAGFAAWAALLAQRTNSMEQTMGGVKRRLAVQNGIQIARQYTYQQALAAASGNTVSAAVADDWGGMTLEGWSGYTLESTAFPAGVNVFAPSSSTDPLSAYAKTFTMLGSYAVSDYFPAITTVQTATTTISTIIKARSPLTSGDLLVVHRPTLASPAPNVTVTGNIELNNGRALYFFPLSPNNFTAVKASRVTSPSVTATPSNFPQNQIPGGSVVAIPSNLPLPTMSGGAIGGTVDLNSRLNVIDDPLNGGNSFKIRLQEGNFMLLDTTQSLAERGVTFDHTTGILTLDLSEADLPNVVAENNVSEIVLKGQNNSAEETAADGHTGSGICYVQNVASSRNLATVHCEGTGNKRRFIMGLKKVTATAAGVTPTGSSVTFSFTNSSSAPVWRLMTVAENTPLRFSNVGAGTVTMQGGIETDGSVTGPSGVGNLLKVTPELDPRRLNRIAPRLAWVESYLDLSNGSL